MPKSKSILLSRRKVDKVNIFWRLVKRLVVLSLIIGLGWTYFNNQQFQQAANGSIWRVRERVAKLIGAPTNPAPTPQDGNGQATPKTRPTDSNQSTGQVPTTGRWPEKTATIFVGTGNPTLDSATNSAIQAWNQTGAFRFRPTTNRDQADIVVRAMDNDQTNAAGLTQQSSNPLTNRFVHADVYLNQRYLLDPLYGYSRDRIVNTAEHELGHAIGLDHTNNVSVMQPAGSFYSIQPADVQAVKQLYS